MSKTKTWEPVLGEIVSIKYGDSFGAQHTGTGAVIQVDLCDPVWKYKIEGHGWVHINAISQTAPTPVLSKFKVCDTVKVVGLSLGDKEKIPVESTAAVVPACNGAVTLRCPKTGNLWSYPASPLRAATAPTWETPLPVGWTPAAGEEVWVVRWRGNQSVSDLKHMGVPGGRAPMHWRVRRVAPGAAPGLHRPYHHLAAQSPHRHGDDTWLRSR